LPLRRRELPIAGGGWCFFFGAEDFYAFSWRSRGGLRVAENPPEYCHPPARRRGKNQTQRRRKRATRKVRMIQIKLFVSKPARACVLQPGKGIFCPPKKGRFALGSSWRLFFYFIDHGEKKNHPSGAEKGDEPPFPAGKTAATGGEKNQPPPRGEPTATGFFGRKNRISERRATKKKTPNRSFSARTRFFSAPSTRQRGFPNPSSPLRKDFSLGVSSWGGGGKNGTFCKMIYYYFIL